ncbi:MAG: MoaD/ThiS family protein [Bauldia sp.]
MRFRYFAAVREGIGIGEEEIAIPGDVVTVADLVTWLRTRGPRYEFALGEGTGVRVALDRVHARPEKPLGGAQEAALFPPMTGG